MAARRRLARDAARPTATCSTACASSRACREVVNYRDWKAKILAGYKTGTEYEDWWHLPDGRTHARHRPSSAPTAASPISTTTPPSAWRWRARYNALIDVQRETLDSLKEGVAVFAHRRAAQAVQLGLRRRSGSCRAARSPRSPHIDEFIAAGREPLRRPADLGAHRPRRHRHSPTQREPVDGQMVRPDQSVIDFAVMPLPDGATLHHLRRRDRCQALRAGAGRAQRGAGRRPTA